MLICHGLQTGIFAATVNPLLQDHSAIWLYFFPEKVKGSGKRNTSLWIGSLECHDF